MEKKQTNVFLKKSLFRIVNISIFLLFITITKVMAFDGYSKKINTNLKNVALTEIISTINKNNIVKTVDNRLYQEKYITITGKVIDKKGEPLPGASILLVKGEKVSGTQTDFDGTYKLNKVIVGNTLTFSFIGYKTKTITVQENKTIYNVVLSEDENRLEEVTVLTTGFQKISKERATGAFTTVSKKELEKPASSISERLVGLVPGLQATLNSSGQPTFIIRGQSRLPNSADLSRGGGLEPLIVYDGFPVDDGFSSINPNDVESITVLKDAAAASIWGSRSANGVIVITSKSGKKGKTSFSFNSFLRVREGIDIDYTVAPAKTSDYLDYQIRAFEKEGFGLNSFRYVRDARNWLRTPYSLPWIALNEERLGNITTAEKDRRLNLYRTLDNRDQIKKYLLQNPLTTQHSFNVRSGSDKMKNSLSLLYEKNLGNFQGNENFRYLISYKNDLNLIKDRLTLKFSGTYRYIENASSGYNTSYLRKLAPWDLLVDEKGNLNDLSYTEYYTPNIDRYYDLSKFSYDNMFLNPVSEREAIDRISKRKVFRMNTGIDLKVTEDLSLNATYQYEEINSNSNFHYTDDSFLVKSFINTTSSWNGRASSTPVPLVPKGDILSTRFEDVKSHTVRGQLNYTKKFNESHQFNFLLGGEGHVRRLSSLRSPNTYGFNPETLTTRRLLGDPRSGFRRNWEGSSFFFWRARHLPSKGVPFSLTSLDNIYGENVYKTVGGYSNFSYTYKNKYTLSGSYRVDASNSVTTNPDLRFNPFWSVGGLWKAKKESFLENVSWLNRLNVRLTYGVNGNVSRLASSEPLLNFSQNSTTEQLVADVTDLGNPKLRWERTATTNLGIEYSVLDNTFFGSVNLYNKEGTDIIVDQVIANVNGADDQAINSASINNRGIELALGFKLPIVKDKLLWFGQLNYSYNRNRVTKFFVPLYTQRNFFRTDSYVEGTDANSLWAFNYNGLTNVGTTASPKMVPSIISNDGKEVVPMTNGLIEDNIFKYVKNKGTRVAPNLMSFKNTFEYNNFNLSFLVTAKFGHVFKRHQFNYNDAPNSATRFSNSYITVNSKVTGVLKGDVNKIAPMLVNESGRDYRGDFYGDLDYLVQNAAHIRFREINLSYNLPTSFVKKHLKIDSLRFYAQANNLGVIVFNDFDEDPEFPMGSGPTFTNSFTLGLNLKF